VEFESQWFDWNFFFNVDLDLLVGAGFVFSGEGFLHLGAPNRLFCHF
jgi:hypothetical protein